MYKRQFIFLFTVSLILLTSINHASTLSEVKEIGHELNDALITGKITAKYTTNRSLNPLKLSVSTNNGVVTLQGFVEDKKALADALRLAKNTNGVNSIICDKLQIKVVNTAFTDAYITTKVEAAILKAKILDDESIPLVEVSAATNNGVVTLSGHLKNSTSISPIIKRVSKIKGVKEIISHLKIRKESP